MNPHEFKTRRVALKLSQAEVARKLRVTAQQYSRWEVSNFLTCKLATALKIEQILDESEKNHEPVE